MGSIADEQALVKPRVLQLFEDAKKDRRPLNVVAPMVRYSKLPFRLLVREYGADVTFVPMMLAHEFIRSHIARDSDFTTHPLEREPTSDGRQHALIAQFASSDPVEFARAAELISPWVDGVDLNCGCPQSWAIKEGIGCGLMDKSEVIASIVKAAKAVLPPDKSVSCKIRIHKDIDQTIRLVQMLQDAGVDMITVHGRPRHQRSSTPPDYAAIRALRPYISVPLIANGDAYTLADVNNIAALTEADGVMAARGILENPTMFAGYDATTPKCISSFLLWAVRCPVPFPVALHHVGEMSARMPDMDKKTRKQLQECQDLVDLVDFVEKRWGLARP